MEEGKREELREGDPRGKRKRYQHNITRPIHNDSLFYLAKVSIIS